MCLPPEPSNRNWTPNVDGDEELQPFLLLLLHHHMEVMATSSNGIRDHLPKGFAPADAPGRDPAGVHRWDANPIEASRDARASLPAPDGLELPCLIYFGPGNGLPIILPKKTKVRIESNLNPTKPTTRWSKSVSNPSKSTARCIKQILYKSVLTSHASTAKQNIQEQLHTAGGSGGGGGSRRQDTSKPQERWSSGTRRTESR